MNLLLACEICMSDDMTVEECLTLSCDHKFHKDCLQ